MSIHDKTVRLEVTDDIVESLQIDDKVSVKIEGVVTSLEAERTFDDGPDDKVTYPPEIVLTLTNVVVTPQEENTFVRMAEEDDREVS